MRKATLSPLLLAAALVGVACAANDTADQTIEPDAATEIEATNADMAVTRRPLDTSSPSAVIDALGDASGVDLSPTGNRVIDGRGALTTAAPLSIALPDGRRPVWIVPRPDGSWIIELDDASVAVIGPAGQSVSQSPQPSLGARDPRSGPPLWTGGALALAIDANAPFASGLADGRVVTNDIELIGLSEPSERYPHGVLGDAVEPTAIDVIDADGNQRRLVELIEPDVFEAVSPLLADVDGDGALEVVVTVSNASGGARVVAYRLDTGELVAQTTPIGLGNRWRNLLAVADTGPDGETELIDIRTPHIGGTLQFFGFDGTSTLDMVAAIDGYSTHSIGSRNLDLGIVSDANGDGQLDVVLPTQAKSAIAVVTRDADADGGAREVFRIDLGAAISTNVSAHSADGVVSYAVGTADGRIVIWPG